jgi:conjugal transfer pilus assembly protein TraK
MTGKALQALLTTALLAASVPAHALQLLEARDGVTAEATVSLKEPTRIRIEGAAITDVFGNLYSSSCGAPPAVAGAPGAPAQPAVNPLGELVLECDRDKGEIYIRPVGTGTKPINLFISSATSTYTLLLRRADMPADTIVIRDKTPRQVQPASGATPGPAGRSPNHIRALKTMLVAMASDRVPPDVRVEELDRPVELFAEARFNLMRLYEGRGLIGEKYLLTNVSAAPMVLAEQEFDREDGDVVAVAIENHNLRPGESTSVYVIRLGS